MKPLIISLIAAFLMASSSKELVFERALTIKHTGTPYSIWYKPAPSKVWKVEKVLSSSGAYGFSFNGIYIPIPLANDAGSITPFWMSETDSIQFSGPIIASILEFNVVP